MSMMTDIARDLRAAIEANGGLHGAASVADKLGVSRERVRQLAQHESFPTPLTIRINGGQQPLWLGDEIDLWARRRKERLKKRAQRGTRPDRMRGAKA